MHVTRVNKQCGAHGQSHFTGVSSRLETPSVRWLWGTPPCFLCSHSPTLPLCSVLASSTSCSLHSSIHRRHRAMQKLVLGALPRGPGQGHALACWKGRGKTHKSFQACMFNVPTTVYLTPTHQRNRRAKPKEFCVFATPSNVLAGFMKTALVQFTVTDSHLSLN